MSSTTTETPSKLKLPSLNVKVSASAVLSVNTDKKDSSNIEKEELKVVDSYMHMSSKDFKKSEHTSFTKAKQNLLKLNHGKVSKVCIELNFLSLHHLLQDIHFCNFFELVQLQLLYSCKYFLLAVSHTLA